MTFVEHPWLDGNAASSLHPPFAPQKGPRLAPEAQASSPANEAVGDGLPRVAWTTVAERLSSVRDLGPRQPTGIAQLDALLRGGLRAEKVMVVGGAPGAGKTTLAAQIADFMARNGVAVGWLAIDEEPAGIDARRLQALGVSRERAEEPDEVTIARGRDELDPLPFHVFDDVTVEDVFEAMAERYPNQPRAIFIDSLQTAHTRQSDNIDSIRERTTDVVATAKRYGRQQLTRAAVVFTSELSRGAYRSKQSADRIEDLAAFKESGAIEYQGHALLVLRSIKGDGARIHVSVPKNRIGAKGEFALRLDCERATFTAEDLKGDEGDAERMASFDVLCDRVLEKVKAHPGISGNRVRLEVGAKTTSVYAALERLAANGAIRNKQTGGKAAKWHAVARTKVEDSDDDD